MTTVLVVDDDVQICTIVSMVLKPSGYNILCAGNAEEMLAMIGDSAPALALVDLYLPQTGMNGWELIEEVRRDERHNQMVIIGITAGSEKDINRAYEVGCDDVVRKPFMPTAIRDLIDNYLSP